MSIVYIHRRVVLCVVLLQFCSLTQAERVLRGAAKNSWEISSEDPTHTQSVTLLRKKHTHTHTHTHTLRYVPYLVDDANKSGASIIYVMSRKLAK